jgi:hypothetical protein
MNDQDEVLTPTEAAEDDGWEFAHIEVFGHRSHWGRCREVERFGAKLLRIDVPAVGADGTTTGWMTQFYGGSSIFSYSPCTEAAMLKANKPYVSPYRLQAPRDATDDDDQEDDDGRPF